MDDTRQDFEELDSAIASGLFPVSYTHLDVYKRQTSYFVSHAPVVLDMQKILIAVGWACLLYTSTPRGRRFSRFKNKNSIPPVRWLRLWMRPLFRRVGQAEKR